ncbi:peptidase M14 [Chryseobacterium sp. Leaf180]|uniref:M14 family zinc carboxypeptidase n=1 Tax=Chryseobacterium sp. Leaf180 TaxID=1736289 RepID=UPI0006F81B9B|nr:M14 family zinc carboxypeptidase [Chryseobacterium sp. Leaf180]KQR95639.1 peptidase M14 [Chryseobacterium sp. Leaf180]
MEHLYTHNPVFENRYIWPVELFEYLEAEFADQLLEIGKSFLGQPIYRFKLGMGNTKIIAWSQMHGNESNATHAMLDFLHTSKRYPELSKDLSQKITLDFIFMLNPDGSEKWTRLNAQYLDLNRDFHAEAGAELKFLKKMVKENNYHYALNLHEQRTIFTTDGTHPATLSFLAPSESVERSVTDNRKQSMAVISSVFDNMKDILPNRIARYTDEFYPNATGDNFIREGLPTILFEGGHFENDYLRRETRKFYTIAFYYALKAIADLNTSTEGWEKYFEIPENRETHYDIIYRNVKLNTNHHCVLDIAVQFKEEIKPGDEEISFIPFVVEVGNVKNKKGWEEIDCIGKKFICETKYPKLDQPVSFKIE